MTNKFGIKSLDLILSYRMCKQHLFSAPFLWLHFFKVKPSMRQISTAFLPHTHTQISFSARFKMQQLQSSAYYSSQHGALTQKSGHHYI